MRSSLPKSNPKIWARSATWHRGWGYFKGCWSCPVGIPWRVNPIFPPLSSCQSDREHLSLPSILGSPLAPYPCDTHTGAVVPGLNFISQGHAPCRGFGVTHSPLMSPLGSVWDPAARAQTWCRGVNAKASRKGRDHTRMKCEKGCG